MNFKLIGHDCPAGKYPAPVVPIGLIDSVAYCAFRNGDDSISLRPLSPEASFVKYNEERQLEDFDVTSDELFALSPSEVHAYKVGEASQFFSWLSHVADDVLSTEFRCVVMAAENKELDALRCLADAVEKAKDRCEPFLGKWYEDLRGEAQAWGAQRDCFPDAWHVSLKLAQAFRRKSVSELFERYRFQQRRNDYAARLIAKKNEDGRSSLNELKSLLNTSQTVGILGSNSGQVLEALAGFPPEQIRRERHRETHYVSIVRGFPTRSFKRLREQCNSASKQRLQRLLELVGQQAFREQVPEIERLSSEQCEFAKNNINLVRLPIRPELPGSAVFEQIQKECRVLVFAPNANLDRYDIELFRMLTTSRWVGAYQSEESRSLFETDRSVARKNKSFVVSSLDRASNQPLWRKAETGLLDLENEIATPLARILGLTAMRLSVELEDLKRQQILRLKEKAKRAKSVKSKEAW